MRKPHPNGRWTIALRYLEVLDIGSKRRFYARAVKFFLEEPLWDSELRTPTFEDHQNMREMLVEFNKQNSRRMNSSDDQTSALEKGLVFPIRMGRKRRQRKKQISRFTREMMLLVRRLHPASRHHSPRIRNRVTSMPDFVRELKGKYYS